MHKLPLSGKNRFNSYAALDIETDGFDGSENNLIAIGVGYYDGDEIPEIEVISRASTGNDELAVIQGAYSWINNRNPEGVVTYHGEGFDFEFLNNKLDALGVKHKPDISATHLDLFPKRRELADRANKKWPGLEECLRAYDIPVFETEWNDKTFSGSVLAEEFAPVYIGALEDDDQGLIDRLEDILRKYTASDIEATIALYEADTGRGYSPSYEH